MIHLIKEGKTCHRCGKDNSKEMWKSEHLENFHYKTHNCSCGKELRVKASFLGDGHDNWDGNLEKRIVRLAF